MEFEKRHNTTDTTNFCPRQLVMDLLRICYGETGVKDFGLIGQRAARRGAKS